MPLIVRCSYGFEQLHFTAPSIERLELVFSEDRYSDAPDRYYSLDCPNLKILYIEDVFIENLKLIDVSSVCKATITNCCAISVDDDDTIVEDYFEPLLKKLQNAQVFQINYKTYLQLEPCGSMKWAFQEVPKFDLAVSAGVHRSCVLGFCRLLRNSCYLSKLVIYAEVEFFCDCDMLLPELSSPCVMKYLTNVTIRDCMKPCQGLLQVIKFLLKSAVILEKLVIICNNKDQLFSLEGRPFIWELLSFPRASQQAKVVIA